MSSRDHISDHVALERGKNGSIHLGIWLVQDLSVATHSTHVLSVSRIQLVGSDVLIIKLPTTQFHDIGDCGNVR